MLPTDIIRSIEENIKKQVCPVYTDNDAFLDCANFSSALLNEKENPSTNMPFKERDIVFYNTLRQVNFVTLFVR